MSHQEIAEELGITQGTVSLTWSGSHSYKKNGQPGILYGGILKKMRKIMKERG